MEARFSQIQSHIITYVIHILLQDYSLEFMPTASTLLPRDPSITLRYRVKLSRMLTDEVLKSTHLIEVSALRTRSLVSNCSKLI